MSYTYEILNGDIDSIWQGSILRIDLISWSTRARALFLTAPATKVALDVSITNGN